MRNHRVVIMLQTVRTCAKILAVDHYIQDDLEEHLTVDEYQRYNDNIATIAGAVLDTLTLLQESRHGHLFTESEDPPGKGTAEKRGEGPPQDLAGPYPATAQDQRAHPEQPAVQSSGDIQR